MSTKSKFVHLGLYFLINLSLSTFNKLVLGKFDYPWILTSSHATFTALGCLVLLKMGLFQLTELTNRENIILALFSTLFTLNIAISNVSLSMVSLPFHQIMRSICPVFTVLIYRLTYGRKYSTAVYLSLIPMVIGIGMATYGDYYFTLLGFCLTALGVILASIKTVASNRLMTGTLKLHPLEILLRMSPLAALQALIYATAIGEVRQLTATYQTFGRAALPSSTVTALLINSALAFAQNISSFQTNKVAGAVTIAVCADLKQCFTILLGITMFHVKIGICNGIGMVVALGGVCWYSWVALMEKNGREGRIVSAPSLLPKYHSPTSSSPKLPRL